MPCLTNTFLSSVSSLYLLGNESEFNNMRFRRATLLHGCQTGNNVISKVRNPRDRSQRKIQNESLPNSYPFSHISIFVS